MAEKGASNKEHPLAGVVLCFTSILPEQRTELATIAHQMGATLKLDLTSDVTHLIVGEINTAKYKFVARERADVTVLKPEWVEAVRQSWMQGEDTDVRGLEEQYKFPTFAGLCICITGFEDMAFRNYIQDTAVAHGAEFRKDLTKQVTHLVARDTESQKYKFATQWNIKVITVKWFTDSIERGMVLEETLYHPLVPEEQQGAGAWNRALPAAREKDLGSEGSSNPRPRKLRRIASAKLVDQNEGIWGDIVGTGSRGSQQKDDSQLLAKRASMVQEAKSFASETTFAEPQEQSNVDKLQRPRQQVSEAASHRDGFLDGCYFFIHGFSSKQTNVLRQHLSFNGAQLVGSLSEFSRPDIPKRGHGLYTIVPYKMPRAQVPSTDDLAFECEVVTDMWLERCLDAKTLVPPESHIANTPIPRFPIPGLDSMKICSTGVSRIDLLHLSKLVGLIGATYNEYLTPSASVLLCNDPSSANQEKLRHTHEWNVPAVTVDWLWTSIQKAQKQPFEPFLIRKPTSQSSRDSEKRADSLPDQREQSQELNKRNNATKSQTHPDHPQTNKLIKQTSKETDQVPSRHLTPLQENSGILQKEPTIRESPTKEPSQQHTPYVSPRKRPSSEQAIHPTSLSAIETTLSGFLQQARAANSRSASDAGENGDRPRSRRRKPLLGRAPSHASVRSNEHKGFSRASSIDTLNEDGCGSAIDSINTDGITSLVNSGRFDFLEGDRINKEEESETPPPMTQLNYEDPDAVAMREKFLHQAGKLVDKKPANQDPIVGEIKELENVGWGSGRRTRNAGKVAEDNTF
ncbi:subunit of DNA polymerase II [Aspergillus nomiae NRRL 13137]|uniref:Subunit of DNA polymerase II n=1 Tax=Aspergillus nomiae NRRL (strain ATCC 15546 / NRRL 13137 / CBS 260.88 / M93) TaxID=1509407 RepID=A0A0L1J7F0_ASPN3|nr:subunit of DNA polymerase II [Aspergillus nomiae NRRL 13137]KNG87333.1 subunit of DNA polymerase II [Aspergillus nomiae NRRL 13137]